MSTSPLCLTDHPLHILISENLTFPAENFGELSVVHLLVFFFLAANFWFAVNTSSPSVGHFFQRTFSRSPNQANLPNPMSEHEKKIPEVKKISLEVSDAECPIQSGV